MLSDSDDNDDITQFTINEHYAKAFQYKKEREELAKLKEKYGSDAEFSDEESTDSESAESEDEDGEELTPAVDAAILRTLARIKNKDPGIYESSVNIFDQEHKQSEKDSAKLTGAQRSRKTAESKSKPYTIRQAALDSALQVTSRSPSPEPSHPAGNGIVSHAQEQETLRRETIAAFHDSKDTADIEDEVEDDLFIPRAKTQDEIEQEEQEYQEFLKSQVGEETLADLVTFESSRGGEQEEEEEEEEDTKKDKKKKKGKKERAVEVQDKGKGRKSKDEEDRDFLLSYILNRGWIDRSANRIPTYGEVTAKPERPKKKKKEAVAEEPRASSSSEEDEDEVDAENDFDDIVDNFESSYNFRFEEPDAATIKRYPRDLASTVRREDTTRKDARQRKKERKEEQLMQKKEEVKRLKALKMKEIRAKLEKIGKVGGIGHDPLLDELDLEADWDPEAHDTQMMGLYDEEGEGPVDDEKPSWDDDIDIGDIPEWDVDDGLPKATSSSSKKEKKKKKKKGGNAEDDMAVDIDEMDADAPMGGFDEDGDDGEEWDGTEEMRKRKLDEYMNELYSMDFNDLVGGLPTRFKYAPVKPTNYGLTPAEILMATDADLNEFMGIKKFAPYKKENTWDSNRNAKLSDFRKKLTDRGVGGASGANATPNGAPVKKRMGKKERMKMKGAQDGEAEAEVPEGGEGKKRKRDVDVVVDKEEVAEAAEQGESGKRKRRRKRKGGDVEVAA